MHSSVSAAHAHSFKPSTSMPHQEVEHAQSCCDNRVPSRHMFPDRSDIAQSDSRATSLKYGSRVMLRVRWVGCDRRAH